MNVVVVGENWQLTSNNIAISKTKIVILTSLILKIVISNILPDYQPKTRKSLFVISSIISH